MKPWMKFSGKIGGDYKTRGTCSRGRRETDGSDDWGDRDAGMETGDAQVGS